MRGQKAAARERSCVGKRSFRTLVEASARAEEMERRVIYDKMEPQAYRCRFCPCFHVGHSLRATGRPQE